MQGPLFDPLPPGYSGPVKKNEEAPESKPKAEQDDGLGLDDTLPIDLSAESVTSAQPGQSKITTFEQKLSASFHCRLTGDSLEFLDRQINEWLDNHPEYEVKMVTSSMGTWSGKLKEPNLIVNVWV